MFELSSLLRNLFWRSFYNQISNFKCILIFTSSFIICHSLSTKMKQVRISCFYKFITTHLLIFMNRITSPYINFTPHQIYFIQYHGIAPFHFLMSTKLHSHKLPSKLPHQSSYHTSITSSVTVHDSNHVFSDFQFISRSSVEH